MSATRAGETVRAAFVLPRGRIHVGVIVVAVGGAANPSVTVRGVTDEGSIPCGFTDTFGAKLAVSGEALNGRSVLVVQADSQPFVIDLIGG